MKYIVEAQHYEQGDNSWEFDDLEKALRFAKSFRMCLVQLYEKNPRVCLWSSSGATCYKINELLNRINGSILEEIELLKTEITNKNLRIEEIKKYLL